MNLQEKSLEVRKIFADLDADIKAYLQASKLTCIPGCGFCCANPKVSASVVEFLPLAFDLYEKGKAEMALEKLEKSSQEDPCIVYRSLSADGDLGLCSDYQNRGMICRLFGSSSRKNKEGNKELITCKKIKASKNELFQLAAAAINDGLPVPSGSEYYTRLYGVDFQLSSDQFPINQAIRKAVEAVLSFKYYQQNQEPEILDNF